MTDELKLCPFCGSTRIEGYTSTDETRIFREYVTCEDCGASTTTYETKGEAVTAWNTRHERTCEASCHECGASLDTNWGYCPDCDEWREL